MPPNDDPYLSLPRPLFTVITVCLNAGTAVKDTAASVDSQTFSRYEHIIKDGGSKDGSLDALGPNPNRRLIQRADTGIYDAMNQALEAARGEFILFLNAGDLLRDETVLADLASSSDPMYTDLVYFDYFNADAGSVVCQPRVLTPFYLFRTMLCHQTCLFNAKLYTRHGGFDTELKVVADYDFLLRSVLSQLGQTRHVKRVGVFYQGGGFSAQPQNQARLQAEVACLRKRHFPPGQRTWFSLLYKLTLPSLRRKLYTWPWLKPLRPIYTRLINGLYSLMALGRRTLLHRNRPIP